jgi:hypothetical protein
MKTATRHRTRMTALAVVAAGLVTAPLALASPASAATATYEIPAPSTPATGIDTSLLDPITIGACNAGFGDVSVASWETGIGHVDLFCGDGKSGYVHIRTEHQSQWQTVVDGAGGGAN